MTRLSLLPAAFLLLGAASAVAQPIIGSPVNAASYTLAGLPNSGVAQGSLFIIFGTGMGPNQLASAFSFPLPTTLAGTSILITDSKGIKTSAIMSYTSAFQVAAILPSSVATGNGTLTLTYNGQNSASAPIQVVANSFGALAVDQSGNGPGVIFNNSQSGTPVNSLSVSAIPGQVAVIWGTGLGPVTCNETVAPTGCNSFVSETQVFVGGVASPQIQYASRTPCCDAIDQINFVIPAGVSGCWVPVYVVVNGVTSNFTTMAITSTGGPCTDPTQLSSTDASLIQAAAEANGSINVGYIQPQRFAVNFNIPTAGMITGDNDELSGQFSQYQASTLQFSPGLEFGGLPSPGYCKVGQTQYKGFFNNIIPGGNNPIQQLGLGAGKTLTISGGGQSASVTESPAGSGQYSQSIGGIGAPGTAATPNFLNPGSFTISNNGQGETVGSFSVGFTMPSVLTWTNQPTPGSVVSRSQNLTINWSGANSTTDLILIEGSSANTTTNAEGFFVCAAPSGSGSFTVPSAILSAIPVSGSDPTYGPYGFIAVAKLTLRSSSAVNFNNNISIGYLSYIAGQLTNVTFQ